MKTIKISFITGIFGLIFLSLSAVFIHIDYEEKIIYILGVFIIYFFSKFLLKKLNLVSDTALLFFSIGFIIMAFFLLLDYHVSISVGSKTNPFFPGGDAEMYHQSAIQLLNGGGISSYVFLRGNYVGYPIILMLLYYLFTPDVLIGLLFNLFIICMVIILIGHITFIITNSREIALKSIILSSLTPQILGMGVILLKDAIILLGMLLFLIGIIAFYYKKVTTISTISLIFSIVIIALFRTGYLFFLILISVFILQKRSSIRNYLMLFFVVFVIGYGIIIGGDFALRDTSFSTLTNEGIKNHVLVRKLEEDNSHTSVMKLLMNNYTSRSTFVRIMTIPIPILIQYLTPFNFWRFSAIAIYPMYFITNNLMLFWIFWIGLLYLFGIMNLKFVKYTLLKKLTISGFIIYGIIAFIYGGAVPRYIFPLFPFIIPIAAWSAVIIKKNKILHVKWIKFKHIYFALVFLGIMGYLIVKVF